MKKKNRSGFGLSKFHFEMVTAVALLNRLAKVIARKGFYSVAADMDATASHMEYITNHLDERPQRTVTVPGGYREDD